MFFDPLEPSYVRAARLRRARQAAIVAAATEQARRNGEALRRRLSQPPGQAAPTPPELPVVQSARGLDW